MPRIEGLSGSGSDETLVVEGLPKPNASAKGVRTSPLSHRPRRSTSRVAQDKVFNTIKDEDDEDEDEDELETGVKKNDGRVAVTKPWNRGQHKSVDTPEDGSVLKVFSEEADGLFKILLADGQKETVS